MYIWSNFSVKKTGFLPQLRTALDLNKAPCGKKKKHHNFLSNQATKIISVRNRLLIDSYLWHLYDWKQNKKTILKIEYTGIVLSLLV